MAYVLVRTLTLDDVAKEWKGCFLTMREPSVEEASQLANPDAAEEKAIEKTMALLKDLFMEGKAFDGKEVVSIKKDDLGELPISVLGRAVSFLLTRARSEMSTQK